MFILPTKGIGLCAWGILCGSGVSSSLDSIMPPWLQDGWELTSMSKGHECDHKITTMNSVKWICLVHHLVWGCFVLDSIGFVGACSTDLHRKKRWCVVVKDTFVEQAQWPFACLIFVNHKLGFLFHCIWISVELSLIFCWRMNGFQNGEPEERIHN